MSCNELGFYCGAGTAATGLAVLAGSGLNKSALVGHGWAGVRRAGMNSGRMDGYGPGELGWAGNSGNHRNGSDGILYEPGAICCSR